MLLRTVWLRENRREGPNLLWSQLAPQADLTEAEAKGCLSGCLGELSVHSFRLPGLQGPSILTHSTLTCDLIRRCTLEFCGEEKSFSFSKGNSSSSFFSEHKMNDTCSLEKKIQYRKQEEKIIDIILLT